MSSKSIVCPTCGHDWELDIPEDDKLTKSIFNSMVNVNAGLHYNGTVDNWDAIQDLYKIIRRLIYHLRIEQK